MARLTEVPADFRQQMLDLHSTKGHRLREEVGDLVLIDAYRSVLPPYTGPKRLLYRGDGAQNRRYRTYGLSWTTDVDQARGFARGWRIADGGSVLLETMAEPDAIIAAPAEHENMLCPEECEYIVDRRRLGKVKVLERFSHLTLPEHARLYGD
ncbi:MAG: hypothetical protein ACRECV_00525 [Xanthobacteraceae bacterium]